MTTTAINEAPAPPQASAAPSWTLGAAPERPGVGLPGQVHITQQGATISAAVRFERGPGPTAEPPDPTPALTEATRRATADSLHVAAVKAVNAKRAVLQASLASLDSKAAELARRRDDPALLERDDLGTVLHEIDLASDAIALRRGEAQRQLDQLGVQLKRAGLPLQIETRRAATEAEQKRTAELAKRYAELQRQLAAVATPLLEQMFDALRRSARPIWTAFAGR